MKASVLHKYDESLTASNWVTYEDVPDPKITKPTDVLVKIGGAGVCRTDLHVIEGQWRSRMVPDGKTLLPYIMGHEHAGWVHAVGHDLVRLKKRAPVILHPALSSGL